MGNNILDHVRRMLPRSKSEREADDKRFREWLFSRPLGAEGECPPGRAEQMKMKIQSKLFPGQSSTADERANVNTNDCSPDEEGVGSKEFERAMHFMNSRG